MELTDFFHQLQAEIKATIAEQLGTTEYEYPFPELAFAEHVIQHMISAGMTFDSATICHHQGKAGNAILKVTGYALSEDCDQLNLLISLYREADSLENVADSETKTAAEQCLRFLSRSVDGKLVKEVDPSNEAHMLAMTLRDAYANLDQIRVYVLTDKVAKSKNFKQREIQGKTVKLEVMDIERLYRHTVAGKPRDELVVDFTEVCGAPLPCIYVPRGEADYDYALAVIPGESLRFLYEKYGARLLEANVRSFLSVTGNVNKGIRETLRHNPSRFMAYNNGLVIVADDIRLGESSTGGHGILWLKGMQVVNGGQTTASLYFTKKKFPEADLSQVRIPAKLIILRKENPDAEEELISAISRYANSQNAVKQADLSANKPFHRELEKIATNVYCPDGTSQWFYERAAGSYNVLLAREGTTPAKLKRLKEKIPSSRKLTKTDLAKYLNTWEKKPNIVALGGQKNFSDLMKTVEEWENSGFLPDVAWFKQAIAKAILFKQADKIVALLGTASKIHVTTHLVSLLAEKLGDCVDLERIWQHQDLSPQLKALLASWAPEVNRVMMAGSNGRLLSEWAKKTECWEQVKMGTYPLNVDAIPEITKIS